MGRLVMTGSPLPPSVAFALISLNCATGASSVTDTPEGGVARAGRMIEAATTSASAIADIALINLMFVFHSVCVLRSDEAFQEPRAIPVYEGKRLFVHTPRRRTEGKRRQGKTNLRELSGQEGNRKWATAITSPAATYFVPFTPNSSAASLRKRVRLLNSFASPLRPLLAGSFLFIQPTTRSYRRRASSLLPNCQWAIAR